MAPAHPALNAAAPKAPVPGVVASNPVAPKSAPVAQDPAQRLEWLKSRVGAAAMPSPTPTPPVFKKRFADKRAPRLRPIEAPRGDAEVASNTGAPKSKPVEKTVAEASPVTPEAAKPPVVEPTPKIAQSAEPSRAGTPSAAPHAAETPAANPHPKVAQASASPTPDSHAVAAHTATKPAETPAVTPRSKIAQATASPTPDPHAVVAQAGNKPAASPAASPRPKIAQATASPTPDPHAVAAHAANKAAASPAASPRPKIAQASPSPTPDPHAVAARAGNKPAASPAASPRPKIAQASASPTPDPHAVAARAGNKPASTPRRVDTRLADTRITDIHPVNVRPSTPAPPKSLPAPSRGATVGGRYPWKSNIVTTVFWIGEPAGGNNFTPNRASSWDPNWTQAYGGYDSPHPEARRNFIPVNFTPRQNPFYVALPYNDVTRGTTKPEARVVIPWFKEAYCKDGQSVCRDRWLAIRNRSGRVAYAQWSDCGPFRTDHWQYVFGMERPKPNLNQGAGLDVSPALRDYLGLQSTDVTDWKFVDAKEVPAGPWALYGDNNPFTQRRLRVAKAGGLPEVVAARNRSF